MLIRYISNVCIVVLASALASREMYIYLLQIYNVSAKVAFPPCVIYGYLTFGVQGYSPNSSW